VDQTLLESPEKKRESRMIAPKSAIDEPAMISWPRCREEFEALLAALRATGER
jgi:hypothetical protein